VVCPFEIIRGGVYDIYVRCIQENRYDDMYSCEEFDIYGIR